MIGHYHSTVEAVLVIRSAFFRRLMCIALVFLAASVAEAGGNSYSSGRVRSNGRVLLISDKDSSPVHNAFVASKNIPTSSGEFALRIISHGDGRRFAASDSKGGAGMYLMPLGKLTAWKPGFWPREVEFKVINADTATRLDGDGTMIILLHPLPPSRHAAAAQEAARLFGFFHSNGKIRESNHGELDSSEQIREELRRTLKNEGGLP